MWETVTESLEAGRVRRIRIRHDSAVLDCAGLLEALVSDEAFCAFFNDLLAAAPYAAYFWETPPLTGASVTRPFECVLVDSPALAGVAADAGAFASYCKRAEAGVAGFANLGGDAWLVAPCPSGPRDAYAHLAAFVRGAPASQQQVFWRRVGEAILERLSGRALWLSTSGLGVYWLHVRLDSTPKYYTYRPYTRPA